MCKLKGFTPLEINIPDRKKSGRFLMGFTLIELLVVIAIIAVLMAIIIPALNRIREQGKRAVCLNNVKQMSIAWNMYADDNNNKLVVGNTHQGMDYCWVYWERSLSEEDKMRGLENGYLFPYCPNKKLYKCPTGIRSEVVTYAIVDNMNGHDEIEGAIPPPLKNRMQIRNPSMQIVFLDEGRLSPSSWTVYYYQERWWDQITARHGDGTNFSFADGHSEYWKWKDPRTVKIGRMDYTAALTTLNPPLSDSYWGQDNPDLHRVQRGAWGKLGYIP